jgi:hypothetical protein
LGQGFIRLVCVRVSLLSTVLSLTLRVASSILGGTGSVGVTFVYWTLGYLVSLNGQEVRIRRQETTTDMPWDCSSCVSPPEPSTWSSPRTSPVDPGPKSSFWNRPIHDLVGFFLPHSPSRVSSFRSAVPTQPASPPSWVNLNATRLTLP